MNKEEYLCIYKVCLFFRVEIGCFVFFCFISVQMFDSVISFYLANI